jgi:hypothetical protein
MRPMMRGFGSGVDSTDLDSTTVDSAASTIPCARLAMRGCEDDNGIGVPQGFGRTHR